MIWGAIFGMLLYIPIHDLYEKWQERRSRMESLSTDWIYNHASDS